MKRLFKLEIALLSGAVAGMLFAEIPQWWIDRDVIVTNAAPYDYAPVNQGQVKHMAYNAWLEFEQKLTNDCSSISNRVSWRPATNDYLLVNLGQLKCLAEPFYQVLWNGDLTNAWPEGMTSGPYPWSGISNAQDYAIANIGQLKYLFSFDPMLVASDSDGDGMPDWWEEIYGLDPFTNDAAGDADGDDLDNLVEYVGKTHPQIANVVVPTNAVGRLVFRYDDDGRFIQGHFNNDSSILYENTDAHNLQTVSRYVD